MEIENIACFAIGMFFFQIHFGIAEGNSFVDSA